MRTVSASLENAWPIAFQAFVNSDSRQLCLPEPVLIRRRCRRTTGGFVMQTFLGVILGAVLVVGGVYIYDSMTTSSVANGQVAQEHRTIVNWDVASHDWNAVKARAHEDWTRLSQR
jgi:hypothetical protein